jgi:transposase
MRRFAIATGAAMLGIALSLFMADCRNHAADKVDCEAVMGALGQGKKANEVAAEMKISTSSVYRCKRQADKVDVERQVREHAAEAGEGSPAASSSASRQEK